MIPIKKLIVLIIIVIPLVSCNYGFNTSNNSEQNKLLAVEVKGNYISPQDGITLLDAEKLIVEHLKNNGIKGDIKSSVKVEEITTKVVWENVNVQLFKVAVDYAWLNGVAIIKDNEVLVVLHGMPTLGVFLADLDEDSTYEIYTNIAMGSGIISFEIMGYNIISNELYHLSNRMQQDYKLLVKDNMLMVNVIEYNNPDEIEKTGRLLLRVKDDLKEIYVD